MDSFEKYEQKPDKAPFKKWTNSDIEGASSDFFSLPDHPDQVVRKIVSLKMKKEKGKMTAREDIHHWLEKAKSFQDFAERYGINVAKTSYFFGSDPRFKTDIPKKEKPALMAITDRISGESFAEMEEVNEKAAVEIDAIFSNLYSGLIDSYNKNGDWWTDNGNGQAVWGTAPREKEPHVYVVDIDPKVGKWSDVPLANRETAFWFELEWVFKEMKEMEQKISAPKKEFEKAREILSQIITEMPVPTTEDDRKLREEIKKEI